jgi:hypothetical protein
MKKYKVFVTDYDGTLLKDDLTISKRTVNAIERFRDSGGIFLIATGRMHSGIQPELKKLGLDKVNIPLISFQGALVKYSMSGETLYSEPLTRDLVTEIADYAESQNMMFHVYVDDRLYIREKNDFSETYARILGIDYTVVGLQSEFLKKTKGDVHKMLFPVRKTELSETLKKLETVFGSRVMVHSPSSWLIDLNSLNAGKEKAIEAVGKKYGFTLEDCVVCGDNYNDLEMVRAAGMGIAVENAVPELFSVAKHTTASNNNDGVAEAIERFCL